MATYDAEEGVSKGGRNEIQERPRFEGKKEESERKESQGNNQRPS